MGSLDLKTFEDESAEGVDKKVMDFAKNVEVKATQPYAVVKEGKIIHFRVVYHVPAKLETADEVVEEKVIKSEEPEPTEKKCPNCGEMINAKWNKHFKCKWGVESGN